MLCARHQRWPAVQNANADLTLSRLIGQALPSVRQGVRGVGVERLELLPYALRRCFADSGVGGGPDSAPVRDRWPPTAALLQTPFQTPSLAKTCRAARRASPEAGGRKGGTWGPCQQARGRCQQARGRCQQARGRCQQARGCLLGHGSLASCGEASLEERRCPAPSCPAARPQRTWWREPIADGA